MKSTPVSDGAAAPAPASLAECLLTITDPRVDRTRLHNFGDILLIAVCCMLWRAWMAAIRTALAYRQCMPACLQRRTTRTRTAASTWPESM